MLRFTPGHVKSKYKVYIITVTIIVFIIELFWLFIFSEILTNENRVAHVVDKDNTSIFPPKILLSV